MIFCVALKLHLNEENMINVAFIHAVMQSNDVSQIYLKMYVMSITSLETPLVFLKLHLSKIPPLILNNKCNVCYKSKIFLSNDTKINRVLPDSFDLVAINLS